MPQYKVRIIRFLPFSTDLVVEAADRQAVEASLSEIHNCPSLQSKIENGNVDYNTEVQEGPHYIVEQLAIPEKNPDLLIRSKRTHSIAFPKGTKDVA